MGKLKVHELAKELGMPSKELVDKLISMKYDVKNHMSTLEDSDVEQFIATMEKATKEFFSKQSSIPTITLEDIEDLLRREVPKDPIKISDQYMYHFRCPTCHNESIYATKNKRCMHCGQVLDWESYEDDK